MDWFIAIIFFGLGWLARSLYPLIKKFGEYLNQK